MKSFTQRAPASKELRGLIMSAAWTIWLLSLALSRAEIPHPHDAPKPKTPEETAASYKVPEGFRVEVIASEPLISSPSAVCWDEHGRMFVSELHGYNLAGQLDIEELNKTGKLDTEVRRVQADRKFKEAAKAGTFGVIKLLTDVDGDGRMDRATVWATNLPPAYGLVPARGGLIVACAPDIIYFADRDGDGWAETREVLFTGFPTGELERGINAPQWGDDGWIYFGRGWGGGKITGPHLKEPVQLPGSDFRIRPDGSAIEPVTGQTHTFGFAMTEAGDRFTVNTTIPGIYIAPLPWRYLTRNPDVATPSLEFATGDRRAYSISKPHPWRQKRADDPAYFKFYNSRYGAAESEADGWFTAACGPMVYRDDVLPGLHGQYFVCEPAGNLIHRALIEQDGSVFKLERAPGEEKSEFAASSDAWSHPMNLTHGPDGAIWITDYYREIIEDYSAIPRHLQQQYGVYNGHDRGRIYRLTHRDAPRSALPDLGKLDAAGLVKECSSLLLWRRQTAQRLLHERNENAAVPLLRDALAEATSPSAIITALFALDQLGALRPENVQPLIRHSDPAVRIHALQLADRWFAKEQGAALLSAVCDQAEKESDPRVQIQFALSLGEASPDRGPNFRTLAAYARGHLNVRWMDSAILSSLHGRGLLMLEELTRVDGASTSFLSSLGQMIGASGDEQELGRTLQLLVAVKPDIQTAVLTGLTKSRKPPAHRRLINKEAADALHGLAGSRDLAVSSAARELTFAFLPSITDEGLISSSQTPAPVTVSEETFKKFVAALDGPRNLQHGHELFLAGCATCHRIGSEGNEVGPDLLGQIGAGEESLLKDVLLPSERIRPGYETTEVELRGGGAVVGLLKSEEATTLTLSQPGGAELALLRKDIAGVRRLETSLMPSFAETLTPQDAADLLGWLRTNLGGHLNYTVSWLGNSFSGASNKWVQNFFIHTKVQADGTVNTWSHWDEGGKKFGVYRDGDVIGNTNTHPNSLETVDKAGRTWRIEIDYVEPKYHEYDFKPKGITCDGAPVDFPGLFEPMALALANQGELMVADSQTSPRQQVLFYDIADPKHPKLSRTFGEYGGIGSGTPGEVTPTKFWGIRGIGMDAAGNLYVAMSEMGTCLRKFSPEGQLLWELRGDFFVDVVCADPTTDAADVWGIQEHYRMDYARPPGKEARLVGYSLNRHKYPHDPRGLTFVKQNGEHGLTSPQVVYLNGRRFLFVGGMFASNFINIFRYDGEMAIPAGLILQWGNNLYRTEQKWPPHKPKGVSIWRDLNGDGEYQAEEFAPNTERVHPGPFWVDKKGNIWMAYGLFRYDFQGLDAMGNPIYRGDKITVLEPPHGVTKVARVVYLDDSDTLIVADEGEDMRHIGRIFVCQGYLAGNRDAVSFTSAAGKEAECVAAAGDYVFTGGWKERGRIFVNRMSDGAAVGVFEPGPTVGGVENTGWIDILTGITAYQRHNGEYLVFVEEDYKAKVLLYRWKP